MLMYVSNVKSTIYTKEEVAPAPNIVPVVWLTDSEKEKRINV